ALDVLPARLVARADVRARIAAELEDAVARRGAVHAGARLRQDLLHLCPVGRQQQLVLGARPHHHLADDDVRPLKGGVRTETEVDLVGERDGERILRDLADVTPGTRLDGHQVSRVPACSRAREAGRAAGRIARSLLRQAAVAGEAPGAVDEDANAD